MNPKYVFIMTIFIMSGCVMNQNKFSKSPAGQNFIIYMVPVSGGIPTQVTKNSPSFWHGWSPDGCTLIYMALRKDQWDLYGIPAHGSKELQFLTCLLHF